MDSPFAAALASAQCMLVVPNRNCSISCRIWCAYGAYLANSWHKEIYIANAPLQPATRKHMLGCPLTCTLLLMLTVLLQDSIGLVLPSDRVLLLGWMCCIAVVAVLFVEQRAA